MTEDRDSGESGVRRRTVLKSAATASGIGLVGVTSLSGTAAAGIGDGRVGHYNLNNLHLNKDTEEKIKNFVHDASPEKNHGTNYGAELVKDGAVGNAFEFNDAYVAVPDFPDITSSLTIAAWIQTNDVAEIGQRIFADDEENDGGYALSVGDGGTGTVRFYNRSKDDVSLDTGNVITADTWYHVAGVYDDTAETRRISVVPIKSADSHN